MCINYISIFLPIFNQVPHPLYPVVTLPFGTKVLAVAEVQVDGAEGVVLSPGDKDKSCLI